MVEALPSTTTRAAVLDQSHISLNGPWVQPEFFPFIITGVDLNDGGRFVVLKLLRKGEPSLAQAAAAEQMAVKELGLDSLDGSFPLVRSELVEVADPENNPEQLGEGAGSTTIALKMPYFACNLADTPQLSLELLLRGGRRMLKALQHFHDRKLAHMDVKPSNVMLTVSGEWFLGDFGSVTRIGQPVWSYTEVSDRLMMFSP